MSENKKQPAPKFNVGDLVKEKRADDRDIGEIIGFSYFVDRGYLYTFTSREVSVAEKKIIKGTTVCGEDELVKVKKEE